MTIRRLGRPPLPHPVKVYSIKLEPWMAEWATALPGGMSALVRDLLRWEHWLQTDTEGSADLAAAKAMAVKGVAIGLDEAEVRDLCACVLRYVGSMGDG